MRWFWQASDGRRFPRFKADVPSAPVEQRLDHFLARRFEPVPSASGGGAIIAVKRIGWHGDDIANFVQ
jgi:hypothetical protein